MTNGLSPYLSPEARMSEEDRLVDAVGGTWTTYGTSVEGRTLRAACIPSRGQAAAPRVLCSANIHGPEYIGGHVARGFLESLAAPPSSALREQAEIWVIPCLNPDGYAKTWASGGCGPLASLRTNARGVDLNRNFPLPDGGRSWLPGAGSPHLGDATYRGPRAFSEPESEALESLLDAQAFSASANLHSFMGTVIPARTADRTAFRTYKTLARAFADGQPRHRYRRLSTRLLDVFTGEQEDHQHHVHGTWAVCVESFPFTSSFRQHWRAPSTFWRFNPRDPEPWVRNDVPGLHAFFEAALRLPRPSDWTRRLELKPT